MDAVSTQAFYLDLYDLLGDPTMVPALGYSTLDATETWLYIPDRNNWDGSGEARILRVNIMTGAVEIWMNHGSGLPLNIQSLTFNHDFSALYFTTSDSTADIGQITFPGKVVSVYGSATAALAGAEVDYFALVRDTQPGHFIGYAQYLKTLDFLQFSGGVITRTERRAFPLWTCLPAVALSGAVYRAAQFAGPKTNGAIVHYPAARPTLSEIDGGYYHDSDDGQTSGPAFSSQFTPYAIAPSADESVLYYAHKNSLHKIQDGVTSLIGTPAGTDLYMASTRNRVVGIFQYVVTVWA